MLFNTLRKGIEMLQREITNKHKIHSHVMTALNKIT